MAHNIPGGFKGFMVSEGSIALNPKTSMLYCMQAMMAGVAISTGMAAGALGLILYVYAILLAVYALLSPNYLLNNKIGGTTALAAIAEKAGMHKISDFLNRRGFAFLMGDSVITMLITVTAAASTIAYLTLGSGAHAESLFVEPGNVRTLLTMGGFTVIVLAIRAIQGFGTNRLGYMMSWIALVWTIATICISLPHIDLTIFIQALNPFNIFAFVTQHPLVAGAVSLAFLAPTGLEMMYADVSHISVVNMRKTATVLVFWAIIIYTAQAGFISTHYAGQVLTDFSGMVSEMSLYFAKLISGGSESFANMFAWFMSIMTVLASAAAVQSTNIGAQVLCQESSNTGNLFSIAYKYPEGCNAEQGYSPFVADILTILGLLIGNVTMIIMGSMHAAHLFDNMYGPVILVTMITTAYTFYRLESKYQNLGKWTNYAKALLTLAISAETILLLSNLIKIAYDSLILIGLLTTLCLSLSIVLILWMHKKFENIKGFRRISLTDFFTTLSEDAKLGKSDSISVHLIDFYDHIPAFCVDYIRDDLRDGYAVQVWKIHYSTDFTEKDLQEIHFVPIQETHGLSLMHLILPATTSLHLPSLVEKLLGDKEDDINLAIKTNSYVYDTSNYSNVSIIENIIAKTMLYFRKKAFQGFQVDRQIPIYVGNIKNPYAEYKIVKTLN